MHQGKHQEYEKKLHDTLIAQTQNEELKAPLNNDSKKKTVQTKRNKETWPSLSNSPTLKTTKQGLTSFLKFYSKRFLIPSFYSVSKEIIKNESKNKSDKTKFEKNKTIYEDEITSNNSDSIWCNTSLDHNHEKETKISNNKQCKATENVTNDDTYFNDKLSLDCNFTSDDNSLEESNAVAIDRNCCKIFFKQEI